MKLNEDKVELFDGYLNKILPEDEHKHFENRLKNDEDFRSEFDEYLESTKAIKLIALREELGHIIDINESKNNRFRRSLVWVPIAASLLFLIFYFWPNANKSSKDLFLTYYRPYPNVITTRSEPNRLTKALQAYTINDYNNAILLFNEISPATDTTLFYRGISYLSMAKPDSSLVYFSRVTPNSAFHQQVNWYMAMAFLLNNDRSSATLYLEKIKSDQFNSKDAQKILALFKER
jgi:hypothetical protein